MWLYGQKPIMVSYPAKFGGYKNSVSENTMFLLCHVISQDHVIKGLFDSMGGKREKNREKERLLQSFLCYTQTQKVWLITKVNFQ